MRKESLDKLNLAAGRSLSDSEVLDIVERLNQAALSVRSSSNSQTLPMDAARKAASTFAKESAASQRQAYQLLIRACSQPSEVEQVMAQIAAIQQAILAGQEETKALLAGLGKAVAGPTPEPEPIIQPLPEPMPVQRKLSLVPAIQTSEPDDIQVATLRDMNKRIKKFVLQARGYDEIAIDVRRDPGGRIVDLVVRVPGEDARVVPVSRDEKGHLKLAVSL